MDQTVADGSGRDREVDTAGLAAKAPTVQPPVAPSTVSGEPPAWVRAQRTVLFADLRGSTALYQRLGNAAATGLVTQAVQALARTGVGPGGRVVKTLGDGLMCLFDSPLVAMQAALRMQDVLARGYGGVGPLAEVNPVPQPTLPAWLDRAEEIRLHVALEHGEVIELGQDCYGDAVNVAARLLEHSGDAEILVTSAVLSLLDESTRRRFRSLDTIALRGRTQPVAVHVCAAGSTRDGPTTWYEAEGESTDPEGIRLWNADKSLVLGPKGLPALLGRSSQARFMVDDARASRSHARLEWRGQCIHLTDLSYNGTHVRFSDGELVTLRRSSCVLHGRGQIGLGQVPLPEGHATVEFELLRFAMTEPVPEP